MKTEQFLNKIDELTDKTASDMRAKARKWLKDVGDTNLSDWENDYRLPKIVMTALCRKAAYQWSPLCKDDRKQVSTIEAQI